MALVKSLSIVYTLYNILLHTHTHSMFTYSLRITAYSAVIVVCWTLLLMQAYASYLEYTHGL